MFQPQKKKNLIVLYQSIGILLLCVAVILISYNVTVSWFMDESITSNGDPNIVKIGTIDLDVTTNFNFYNLVLAPDTYYTTYEEGEDTKSYGTYISTASKNDIESIYVRVKFTTNRSELTLYFDPENITTSSSYDEDDDFEKWYLHTDGYYYYIGSVGSSEIEFNAGYHVDNTLDNSKAYEDVRIEFVFESIQRPYGAYQALWETAPTIFNEFALADNTGA